LYLGSKGKNEPTEITKIQGIEGKHVSTFVISIVSYIFSQLLIFDSLCGVSVQQNASKVSVVTIYSFRESRADIARIKEELLAKGARLPPEKEKGEHFDSNCITPVSILQSNWQNCVLIK